MQAFLVEYYLEYENILDRIKMKTFVIFNVVGQFKHMSMCI